MSATSALRIVSGGSSYARTLWVYAYGDEAPRCSGLVVPANLVVVDRAVTDLQGHHVDRVRVVGDWRATERFAVVCHSSSPDCASETGDGTDAWTSQQAGASTAVPDVVLMNSYPSISCART
jgi:hypothetical protein